VLCATALALALALDARPSRAADQAPPGTTPPGAAAPGTAAPADTAAAPPPATVESWPLAAGAKLEVPAGSSLYGRKTAPPRQALPGEARFARPGLTVDGADALDEIIDEIAADMAHLGAARLSPILLDRIRVAPPLEPGLASILEARLAAALHRAADIALVRCVECDATRAEVVDASWVVSRGVTRVEQLQQLGRRAGARTLLRASLSSTPGTLALDVELLRTDDAAIAWAESYRFGGENAILYRSADRAQTREHRLRELEARLDEKPYWGFAAQLGFVVIPGQDGRSIQGPFGMFRLDEKFGDDRQHRISVGAGGLQSPGRGISGGVVQIGLWTRVSRPNVWAQQFHVGASFGWFVGGAVGNAPWLALNAEYRIATRIGLHASLGYVDKFRYLDRPDQGRIGGITPEGGVSFLW
jgi:hypothetical protein